MSAPSPLRSVLEKAKNPAYHELAMRLLFCTTIAAGDSQYRIREIEMYHSDDPYTHQGDEQVSSTGGWYFHRTKPGGGWKGGTFMGVDISFAPIGTAGGVLIRGISRVKQNGDAYQYIDGSCNCVKELLKACGVSKIKELVEKPNFEWDALNQDGILKLVELPEPTGAIEHQAMEWKACSRIGLSEPGKFPEIAKARAKYHLAPLRFLQAPYETKKEKTKIKNSTNMGVFTKKEYKKLFTQPNMNSNSSDVSEYEPPAKKQKKSGAGSGDKAKSPAKQPKKFKIVIKGLPNDKKEESNGLGDSSDDEDEFEWEPTAEISISEIKQEKKDKVNNMQTIDNKPEWHYWLDDGMDGMTKGWHKYDSAACDKLEGFLKNKGKQLSRTTWHLKSGYFRYEVDISKMTQRNMKSGTVRPIRRVLPGEVCSTSEGPVYIPPKKDPMIVQDSDSEDTKSNKSEKAKTLKEPDDDGKTSNIAKVHGGSGLKLEPLFVGKFGHSWETVLTDTIEAQPNAAQFIGPERSKDILPIREMTFRALMAVAPEDNNLVVFGQGPYPRMESASGIAMFDTLIKDWDSPQFGKTVSMRCIAKAAAVAKGIVSQDAKVKTLRQVFKQQNIVSPPEWFQAMLAQGVLLLNASLTIGSDISTAKHTNFWKPVMQSIVREILRAKVDKFPVGSPKRRIGFLWWGNEALKTKKFLAPLLAEYSNDVEITHIEHYNPAAQGDKFTQPPNHFEAVNKALIKGNLEPIDWLPNKAWLKEHHLDEHAAFITDTQELHQMYLDRLQAGLDLAELKPIVGIMELELLSLPDACDDLGLASTAESALTTVQKFSEQALDDDEKGAIYLYTTNVLYRRLNEALRNANRSRVKVYFNYLRVFLQAYNKMKSKPKTLYRGMGKDLSKQYAEGAQVVWWNVSSCTPNLGVAQAFGGGASGGTLFHVKAKTAVPIMHLSAYQSEEEWVLAPGTALKVEKVVKKPGKATEIFLEEIEGKRWVK